MQWDSLCRAGQRCVWPENAEHADCRPPTLATRSRELLLFHKHNDNYLLVLLSPFALRHLNESSRPSSFITSPFIRSYHSLLACHTCPRTRSVHPPELSLSLSTNRHWRSLQIARHTLTIGPALLKLLDSLRHHLPHLA